MGITVSPIVWVARKGEIHNTWGDPYDSVCTIIKTGSNSCLIEGLVGSASKKDYLEITTMLKSLGFEKIEFVRSGNHKAVELKDKLGD